MQQRRNRPGRAAAMMMLLLAGCLGCNPLSGGPSVSGSSEEATVSGSVRIRGKPVGNGQVIFHCANVSRPDARPRLAPINDDGTYTIKTLVGENNVEVSCKELQAPKNSRYAEDQHLVVVQSGENAFDIEIPPGSSPKAP